MRFFNVFLLETLDKMTNLNFVKYKKNKHFFWPLKVGSNLNKGWPFNRGSAVLYIATEFEPGGTVSSRWDFSKTLLTFDLI